MALKVLTKTIISSKNNFSIFFHNSVRIKHDCTRTRITDIYKSKSQGSQTTLKGWVKGLRKMKDSVFVDLYDGSCSAKIQVFIPRTISPANLTYGSAIEAIGDIKTSPQGQLELTAEKIIVVGDCTVTDGYPFAPRKTYSPDYLRQFLHFRPRTNYFGSLLRVRDATSHAFHKHFRELGFFSIHTPILTSNDCEGAGEVFTVKPDSDSLLKSMVKEGTLLEEAYFDTKVFLTVSGQLHLETAVRALNKVYSFGPTFRAENSKTRLHLSEFYMIEGEVAFVDSLDGILSVMETMIKNVTRNVLNECEEDVKMIFKANNRSFPYQSLIELIDKPFGVVTYDDAIAILNKHPETFSTKIKYGHGLGKEHEMFLVKFNQGIPVFVVNWPSETKPFYMKQTLEDPNKVAAVDLLVPEVGELCGGSIREDDYSMLEKKLVAAGLDKTLAWYLELRKFGNVPTAGFGMGFERYLQLLLGITNIKDTIPFPRWPHNCKM